VNSRRDVTVTGGKLSGSQGAGAAGAGEVVRRGTERLAARCDFLLVLHNRRERLAAGG